MAASLAYFRGVELPRRIKRYGKDRISMGGERGGYAFPGTGMSGYGSGKRDCPPIEKGGHRFVGVCE